MNSLKIHEKREKRTHSILINNFQTKEEAGYIPLCMPRKTNEEIKQEILKLVKK